MSCKDDSSSTSTAPAPSPEPSTTAAASNVVGVEHYICPNGHAGFGSDAAGTCSQCGATLEHNAAFHNNDPAPNANEVAAAEDQYVEENINRDVEHYICPNGHVGSGGDAAGTCAQCGATLEHNAAYHNDAPPSEFVQDASPVSASQEQIQVQPSGALSPVFQNSAAAPIIAGGATGAAGSPTPEPAQNAAGVWHYICSDGHTGGAGSAIACSQCGKTLVHNAAYHN